MGNNIPKKRVVKVNNVMSRLTKQEKINLKDAFDRIQDNQVITDYQFRLEVLGPQVPESIALKLIQLFSSEDITRDVINFEDLLCCYVVFKQAKPEEIGQICFELMKMTTGVEYLSREQITLFSEKLVNLNEQVIHTFYAKTEFDPRLPIKKDEFVSQFKKVSNLQLFTWVPKLIEGYSKEHMNMDESDLKQSDITRKLTVIQNDKTRSETESMGFDSNEYDSMKQFFDQELKKNDPKEVLRTINLMFKDIRISKLKKFFVDALTKQKALDFKYLTSMVFFICKETDPTKKLEFLFDLFSFHTDSVKKYFFLQLIQFVNRKQLREFGEIFKIGASFFVKYGNAILKTDFLEELQAQFVNLDFTVYEKCKYSLISMIGLKPQSEEEEREAILSALDNNHNVEAYIHEHLDEEDTFYVIEKNFYEAWCMNIGFIDDKSYVIRKEKITIIDNQNLLEPMHDFRMKEVVYNEDFIIVPKFVFVPLSKWYNCTKTIERKVISYKSDKKKSIGMFKQRRNTAASIIIGNTLQVPDQFYKTVGDLTFELEVYPKFFYYEKINEKGERPHQKAIVNQKIDQNYVKKVLKQDKLPFFEMQISRKTTFEQVLKDISTNLKENYKRGRLWIEDQIISGAKLELTLEEFGISLGQVIFAEYANNNNQWPTDKLGVSPVSGQKSTVTPSQSSLEASQKQDNVKTVGLYNLGNTCYMNSALQCLANTKFFYEYFMKEKKYMKQMNLKNKLGHQGELANNFAQLLQKMYSSNSVVVPRSFKNAISTLSEQFQGYDQQDSQEFLAFLLDGLHEELNLRVDKPYMENPDSDERKIVELGLESWSNTLRREWSFIFFLFYGQLKSTLNCQGCNKISTTFDIFTNIPLSLPEPSKILLHVIIYRLPNEIKDIFNSDKSSNILKRIDSQRSEDFHFNQSEQANPILQKNSSVINQPNLHKIKESFNYITNDQPIHIAIRVDKDIKISQLMQLICEVRDVNIDSHSKSSQIVLYSQIKGIIRGIFNPEYRLTQYNLLTNEIEAIEVLSRRGREMIRNFYRDNQKVIENFPNAPLTCLMGESEKMDDNLKPQTQSSTAHSRKKSASKASGKDMQQGIKIDKCNLFNSYQVAYDRYQDFEDNGNFPDEIYAVGYHRRFIKKAYYFFTPYQPQLFSSPVIFIMPIKPTGRRVYEEVWAVAQNCLKKNSIYHDRKNLWWEKPNWEEKLLSHDNQLPISNQTFKPFVLKTVDRSGYSCSQCNWMQTCSGCILPPSNGQGEFIEDFFRKCHIAIEWHATLIEDEYNSQSNEVVHHPSTQDKEILDEDFVNLEDCLRKFHEIEEIGSTDQIYCSGCRQHQGHLKKLEIFRPPPILIVQLKRFKFSNTSRNKLTTLVEFPFYNLDLSTFTTDQDFLQSLGIDQKYDLYAMINHFGTLHFGHYISIVKNLQENKWYKYDDSNRTQITEDQIQKESAYILFYIRKDVQSKQLDDLLPNIKDFFPGKPVKTEAGDGFIINREDDDRWRVQYEKGKDTQIVRQEHIFEEKDQNELIYDAKDLVEIESQKKEKLIEKQRQQKAVRSCGMCSGFGRMRSSSADTNSGSTDYKNKPGKSKKRSIKSSIYKGNNMSDCSIF